MHLRDSELIFSPSDLTNYMESKFVSFMDRLSLQQDPRATKDAPDESMQIIRDRGIQHERAYLELLKQHGTDVCEISDKGADGIELTLEAIKSGRQVIYQAHLLKEQFFGNCDFLVRVEDRPSELLGTSYSYEPYDTKLALKPKPYFAIQLCAYAEMLELVQGVLPEQFVIILGDKTPKSFRTEDFIYFYRQLKKEFLEFHDKFDGSEYPEEIDLPPFCQWKGLGEDILEKRDDLCRIANIRKSQIVKLKRAGIKTLTQLAQTSKPSIEQMSGETFTNLKEQADLQLRSKGLDRPLYTMLPIQVDKQRHGLALLPPTSPNDVFFDMEGYPHVEGGLEYLFGATYLDGQELKFFERWAHDEKQEKIAFEEFVDWVYQRFEADSTMHVYHYAQYEPTAMRRLMGKFGSREYEIDQLLRHEVFLDLYTVVKQSLRVGEPGYSIKNIEPLYRGKRAGDVSTAMDSVVWYYKWLECKDGDDVKSSKMLSAIRDYNKVDCDSTYELYGWLCNLQNQQGIRCCPPPPPTASKEREDDAAARSAREVVAKHGNGTVPTILSQLLHFHKREDKPVWWSIFDKRTWTPDDLYADLDCIAGLSATKRWGEKVVKSNLYEFTFDADQETKIDKGNSVCFYKDDSNIESISVKELDTDNGQIALTSSQIIPPKQLDIVKMDLVSSKTISDSIFDIVSDYCAGRSLPPAIEQFLERKSPSLRGHQDGHPFIAQPQESLVSRVIDVIRRMDESTLCIQGPPGSGKTHTGAEAILALLSDGKKIGVTSNSHKAIEVLLDAVAKLATERSLNLKGAKIAMDSKDSSPPTFAHPGIAFKRDSEGVFGAYDLIGGTAYAFSRTDAVGALNYLFVDEAGQVSVANPVAMSRSAKNLVLLGDQMQLEQPVRGAHPGISGLSTLQYYLKEHSAMPPDKGIFLGVTRRLPPELCQFISSAIYEGKLSNLPSTANRRLINPRPTHILKEVGLIFDPVPHAGCVQSSEQEAARIKQLIEELSGCQIEMDGKIEPLIPKEHILIVAPYNKQVRLLKQLLPGFEIGTVDKFQGRQKPVVIVSMADSDANESARGMDFLFSKNRLNVAISRAQILAIVVANPSLAHADCNSLKYMALLNLFSRVVQCGSIAVTS